MLARRWASNCFETFFVAIYGRQPGWQLFVNGGRKDWDGGYATPSLLPSNAQFRNAPSSMARNLPLRASRLGVIDGRDELVSFYAIYPKSLDCRR